MFNKKQKMYSLVCFNAQPFKYKMLIKSLNFMKMYYEFIIYLIIIFLDPNLSVCTISQNK